MRSPRAVSDKDAFFDVSLPRFFFWGESIFEIEKGTHLPRDDGMHGGPAVPDHEDELGRREDFGQVRG